MPLESVKPGFESWLSDLLDISSTAYFTSLKCSFLICKNPKMNSTPLWAYSLKTHYASDIVLDAGALSYSDNCYIEKELKTE